VTSPNAPQKPACGRSKTRLYEGHRPSYRSCASTLRRFSFGLSKWGQHYDAAISHLSFMIASDLKQIDFSG
jgi:hypothetical protein